MAADIGSLSTIAFAGGWHAELTNITWSGISRESIDVSTMVSVAGPRVFLPGALYDPGEISIEGNLDPSVSPIPELTAVESAFTLTLKTGGGADEVWSASGFLTSYELGAVLEDKQTFSATIKLTGAITVAP